jgi:DHA3 family macrolide efflux protein-like MFS transporter
MIPTTFYVVWAGQVVSVFGSNLSGFALGVWLYQRTGSASNFAFVALCTVLPQILLSPVAGVLVDRYNRRWMMALSDSGATLCTLYLAVLFFTGNMQVWHIFLVTALSSAFGSLQMPAYSALVASTTPHSQLGRVNGLIQFGQALADFLAPSVAGLLVVTIQVPGVLLIDLLTFGFAIFTLTYVRFPGLENAPSTQSQETSTQGSWRQELQAGWRELRADHGLLNLLRYQTLFAFLWSLFAVLVTPMILGFSSPEGLGIALTIAGGGLLVGSLLMTAWGGPKRRLSGLLFFELISAATFCLMGVRPNLLLVAGAAFLAHWTLAFVSSLAEAIWQGQVSREVQGRIFALKQTAVKAGTLCAYLLAGVLADRFLEPLLRSGGALSSSLGSWFGIGPGRGIAVLFIGIGVVKAISVIWIYATPGARQLDRDLSAKPDPSHGHLG